MPFIRRRLLAGAALLGIVSHPVPATAQMMPQEPATSPGAAELPGGISGNLDLPIQRALARADGALSAKAMVGDAASNRVAVPSFTGSCSKHFRDDTPGAYLVGAYSQQNFGRGSISFNQYMPRSASATGRRPASIGSTSPMPNG